MADEPAPRPSWLDDDFLRTCLINSKQLPQDTNVDIEDVKLTYVVAKGENFMSMIYRVVLEYNIVDGAQSNGVRNGRNNESDSFIVKVSHEMEQFKKMAKDVNAFVKEMDMYANVMPKLTKLLEDVGIEADITCRCLHTVLGDREVLVVEDLKPKGYVIANRLVGLDLAHTKLVIDKLAKMHAASMVDIAKNGISELYSNAPFDNDKAEDSFTKEMIKTFRDSIMEKIDNIILELSKHNKYKKHAEFYRKYGELDPNGIQKVWKRIEGNKLNALIHGDCWVNNMMFKYDDDGSVDKVLLIDLQISYHSSVGNDFLYFFFSSTNDDVKRHHFKDVQKYYIEQLTLYLKKLHYAGDIPTLEELHRELGRLLFIAIYMITTFNSIIFKEFNSEQKDRSKSEAFDMDDFIEITSNMSSTHLRVLLLSIDVLEENGYFDSCQFPPMSTNNNKED